jgi:hypothetical protein
VQTGLRMHRSALLAMLVATWSYPSSAWAHSLGGNSGPTPPVLSYIIETQTLSDELQNGVGIRGVLDQFKLWPLGAPLIICFNNGDRPIRDAFVETSQRWLTGTSLKFDFGSSAGYRTCSRDGEADFRVSFNPADGHWSYLGTDSRKYRDTSLNIGFSKVPADSLGRSRLEEVILHEVGHALGFEHEHQSPESRCDEEFDWPKVYEVAKTKWGWVKSDGSVDKKAVDFNLRVLTSKDRLRMTGYDPLSIMHYHFDPVLFKQGQASRCFVGHNRSLSKTDKEFAQAAYPVKIASQDSHLQKRADVASVMLAPMNLNKAQLSRVGRALGQVLTSGSRKISLDFDLARASGRTPTRGAGDFRECEMGPTQPADAKSTVTCEIASDASAFFVGIEPK